MEGGRNLDIAALVKHCQSGDLQSFSELYKIYSQNALGTAYLIAGRKGLAEDIVQEAFIQCFRAIKSLRNVQTFDVWFYKILVRTGWRMVSKCSSFIMVEDMENETFKTDCTYDTNLDSFETSISVHDAVNKLSIPLRTVIILYYFNDMTIKEISSVLGCFEGTVKSRLHNARKALQEILGEGDEEYTLDGFNSGKECSLNDR